MKNFIMIGAGGYIAPRHLEAIKNTGNTLLAALDKNDSVGILDNYFPDAHFFTEFERFDRHVEKLKRQGISIDYLSVCSPNYLHDAHIRFGLRAGANVICEKPVVLNPWNVDALLDIEKETPGKVYTILQLRHHPAVIALKERVEKDGPSKKYKVAVKYITARGNWYHTSWKGNTEKSGGITTNIGTHFFDVLCWIFGEPQKNTVTMQTNDTAAGQIEFNNATVEWLLSIDAEQLPADIKAKSGRTYRSFFIDGEEIQLNEGFTDLHTVSYQQIIDGNGFTLAQTKTVTQLLHDIRNYTV